MFVPKKKIYEACIRRVYGDHPPIVVRVIDKDEAGAFVRAVQENWGPSAFYDAETKRIMWANGKLFKRTYNHDFVALTGVVKITLREIPHAPKD